MANPEWDAKVFAKSIVDEALEEIERKKLLCRLLFEGLKIIQDQNWTVLSKESRSHAASIERKLARWRIEVEKQFYRFCPICDDNVEVDEHGNCLSGACGGTYDYRDLK